MKRALILLAACGAPSHPPAAPTPAVTPAVTPSPSCPTLSVEAAPQVVKSGEGAPHFAERTTGYFHESSTPHVAIDAVWPALTLPALVMTAHPIPSPCGNGRGSEGIAIRTVTVGSRHIGHARVVRAGVTDEPTLPPGPAGPAGCAERERLRIEDHFVDLDTGAYLFRVAQVVDVAAYGPAAPLPGVPFESLAVDDSGVTAGECQFFWND